MPSIEQFKANFQKGGARSTKFRVKISNPTSPSADIDIPFLCRAATLPEYTIKPLDVAYFGRKIHVAGSKEYAEWTVKIYNDENFLIKDAIERWMDFMNANEENVNQFASSDITNYKSVAEVDQLSQTDQVLRTYKIYGIFPTKMDPVALDWDNEAIEEFSVTFAVDYVRVTASASGSFAGDQQ